MFALGANRTQHVLFLPLQFLSVDLCFPLQMEVNAVKKRHRTRSKGVRGRSLSLLLSVCLFIGLVNHCAASVLTIKSEHIKFNFSFRFYTTSSLISAKLD